MLCWLTNENNSKITVPVIHTSRSVDRMCTTSKTPPTEFPPPGYRPTPINHLLVNALDLTAPASDALLKNRKNAWVQVAGHPGSFAPASQNTIWKKRLSKENNETVAYRMLMNDVVRDIVPKFHREVEYGGEIFIEIEDLLQHFTDPSIMDIKMGTRTFLESEVKNPVLRKDLYDKMVKLDSNEPTEQENEAKAITKLRYMQFRERDSSTSTLGFRIEALKMSGEAPDTDLKKIKTEKQVKDLICQFLHKHKEVQKKMVKRFKDMRRKIEMSKFFKHHEMIGSSILILFDKHHNGSAWMIDFAKTFLVEGSSLTHRTQWEVGNHEDGYLSGIDNLIRIFSELDLDSCHVNSTQSTEIPVSSTQHEIPSTPTHLHNDSSLSPHLHNNSDATSSNCVCSSRQPHMHDGISFGPHLQSVHNQTEEHSKKRRTSHPTVEDLETKNSNKLIYNSTDIAIPHTDSEKT